MKIEVHLQREVTGNAMIKYFLQNMYKRWQIQVWQQPSLEILVFHLLNVAQQIRELKRATVDQFSLDLKHFNCKR